MRLEIFDNLLSDREFQSLSEFMLGREMPWSYSDGVNMPGDGYYQFTHVFYNHFEPQSPYFGVLSPILKQIDPVALVRIKSNLNIKTPQIERYEYHTDVDDCITAIYYVNTNNGTTKFKSGEEVESIANRLIIFNSNEQHAGSSCTDESRRCLINFNYFI
mgnify:FL=1|tara:strand:+ start:821 stop:1300 length:480 start_codon:yes stop_codon:yes gene_type:complete